MTHEEAKKMGATHYNRAVNRYTKQGGYILKDWLYWGGEKWQYLSNKLSDFNKPL